jgi:Leucine-rich repeat (LRR) protein
MYTEEDVNNIIGQLIIDNNTMQISPKKLRDVLKIINSRIGVDPSSISTNSPLNLDPFTSVLSLLKADAENDGYLSKEDWIKFNSSRVVRKIITEDPYFLIQSDDDKFLTITTEFDPVLSLGFTANTEFWIKNTSPTPREVTFDTDIEFIGSPLIPTNGLAILKLIEVVGGVEYWSVNHLLANGTPSGDGFKKNIFFTTSLADLGLTTFDELTNEIVKDWIDSLEIVENDNEIYYFDITDEVGYNFDVTADWENINFYPVIDENSFVAFLENYYIVGYDSNDLTDIVVSDFTLVGNRLRCNLSANGTRFHLNECGITQLNCIGDIYGLQNLNLDNNLITEFNTINSLPSTLQQLTMQYNQLTGFNPTISLPSNLVVLRLNNNEISLFNYPLNENIIALYLDSNQLNDSSYTAMEDWANDLPYFTSGAEWSFFGNIDAIEVTTLYSILLSKNISVNP